MHMKDMNDNIILELINDYNKECYIPSAILLTKVINISLTKRYMKVNINLTITDDIGSEKANVNFRNKTGATNILSFCYHDEDQLCGDLIICAPLLQSEAHEQNISEKTHWLRLFVHGVLHLQGYDHQEEKEAIIMESLEDNLLAEAIQISIQDESK